MTLGFNQKKAKKISNDPWHSYYMMASQDVSHSLIMPGLIFKVIQEKRCLFWGSLDGEPESDTDSIESILASRNGHLLSRKIESSRDEEDEWSSDPDIIYQWDDSVISFSKNKYSVSIYIASTNEKFVEDLISELEPFFKPRTNQGSIYSIGRSAPKEPLQIIRVGSISCPIERGNYEDSVLRGFDFAVSDLKKPNPDGRIVILDGPPGTGKTFLIRSFITELSNSLCVVVPPKLASSIGDPDFIPLLLEHRRGDQPIVLILEDADKLLSPRSTNNIDDIASTLNIGDGIIGDAFNMRIIASTNKKIEELDEAVMRDGRLSVRIAVDKLSPTKAKEVFDRLAPGAKLPSSLKKPVTLAKVYAEAKKVKQQSDI